jgi:hypothetical protein
MFGPVRPGLTSWGILSRPFGTGLPGNGDPGLTSWATLSRPFGTGPDTSWIADLSLSESGMTRVLEKS